MDDRRIFTAELTADELSAVRDLVQESLDAIRGGPLLEVSEEVLQRILAKLKAAKEAVGS